MIIIYCTTIMNPPKPNWKLAYLTLTFFGILFLIHSQTLSGQTTISGGIVSGHWTKAGSPYLVRGSILIPDKSTLRIDPGVVIDIRGQYKIDVKGRILAVGLPGDSIYFINTNPELPPDPTPNPKDSSFWNGIDFIVPSDLNDTSKFDYCVIEKVGRAQMFTNAALEVDNFSKLTVSNSRFSKNGFDGYVIYLYNGASPRITHNTISYNRARGIVADYGSNAYIANNKIVNNQGTGLCLINCGATVVNNLIANNTMQGGQTAGGVFFQSNNTSYFSNNTIVNNHSVYKGGGLYFSYGAQNQTLITNCIIYGNTAGYAGDQVFIESDENDPNFNSNIIQGGLAGFDVNGGVYVGDYLNNIDANPLFVNPTAGIGHDYDALATNIDWSLQSNSPAIDKGIIDMVYPETDLANNPRVNVCRVDIGAYEYQTGIPLKISFTTNQVIKCFGDNTASVTAQVSGSIPPYKYNWNTGDTTTTLNNMTAGNYLLTVSTPSNGCVVKREITITQPNQLIMQAGADKTGNCMNQIQLDSIVTNIPDEEWRHYTWTPSLHLNSDTLANPIVTVKENITYKVEVRNANGCKASDSVNVSIQPLQAPEICIVSVTDDIKNQIVWNKPQSSIIDSFFVNRETNITGNYQTIGFLAYSDFSAFVDETSIPEVKSDKYVLTLVDKCGIATGKQDPEAHKTMHLTINKGQGNNWNLIWEKYEGFTVTTYNIYRGTSRTNLVLIGTSAGSNFSYTDINPPAGDLFYQLEIISPNSCTPSKNYNTSKSNIAATRTVSIGEGMQSTPWATVFPNPAVSQLNLVLDESTILSNASLVIQDINGKTVKTQPLENRQSTLDISNLKEGAYIYRIACEGQATTIGKLIIYRP